MIAHSILGSPPFVALGVAIAKTMPPRFGYWIARRVARGMANRRNTMFGAVRANLAHVVGEDAEPQALDAMAEDAIFFSGCSYYDMFRESLQDMVRQPGRLRVDQDAWEAARQVLHDPRGTFIAGIHMSGFDLAGQWFAAEGLEIQTLSLADPNPGTRFLNRIRKKRGLEVTPIEASTLRGALRRLREGGIVMTGIDRPLEGTSEGVPFFGRPAQLATGFIRLALAADAWVLTACCIQEPDQVRRGGYTVLLGSPLRMERTGSKSEDVSHNMRRVLTQVEGMIRRAPDQWLMFVPVWQ